MEDQTSDRDTQPPEGAKDTAVEYLRSIRQTGEERAAGFRSLLSKLTRDGQST